MVGGIERLDPRMNALVPADASLEVIAEGLLWAEGPLWQPGARCLLFSDVKGNAIYRWDAGAGVSVFMQPSGYFGRDPYPGPEPGANGLTLDPAGRLVICEHGERRVRRIEPDGQATVLADRYLGGRFNSPNDLVYARDGALWFTDPPYGLPLTFDDPSSEQPVCGVYRLAAHGTLTLATGALRAPNGLAFSPDGAILYLADSHPDEALWLAFPVQPDGSLGTGRLFADAKPWRAVRAGGPDGLKVDAAGNLWAAGPEGVYVFAPDATLLGRIATDSFTSNLAWGGEDGLSLFITADTRVLRIRVGIRGAGT
jgi:gluconolactonase